MASRLGKRRSPPNAARATVTGSTGTAPGTGATGTTTTTVATALQAVGNLFSRARPGQAMLRPDDLLALRLQLVNLGVRAGSPPRLRRIGTAAARLILHLPPQSIAEEVFYENRPVGVDYDPDTPPAPSDAPDPAAEPPDLGVDPPPIRARAAGESRLVFEWPAGFECDYTVAGVLAAVQQLKMKVPVGARPRPSAPRLAKLNWPLLASLPLRAKASPRAVAGGLLAAAPGTRRAAVNGFGLRQTLIAMRGGAAAEPTLLRRLTDLLPASATASLGLSVQSPPVAVAIKPKPGLPAAQETALELPWRLVLAPHADERWRHALLPAAAPGSARTELWHTRLLGPAVKGQPAIEPPHADPGRTVRAVWATTGLFGQPMQKDFPQGVAGLPLPGLGNPFLTTLDDSDRQQVVHLSANYSMANYRPTPVDTNLLMLSALGAWLDSRGDWEPPGLDLESWVHRASMGRDHYVRVVYRGVLFPFGHRAVLIKVSERKFHRQMPGNPAYLRQRMFLVVRERLRRYDDAGLLQPYGSGDDTVKNEFPFTQVRLLTTVTPDLSEPDKTEVKPGQGQRLFWPATGLGDNPVPFRFRLVATDLDGRDIQFELPLIFMSNALASPRRRSGKTLVPLYTEGDPAQGLVSAAEAARWAAAGWAATQTAASQLAPGPNDRTAAAMRGQRVAMALSAKPGDTAIEAVTMTFGVHVPADAAKEVPNSTAWKAARTSEDAFSGFSQKLTRPMFFPRVLRAQARIGAMAQLTGTDKLSVVKWNPVYSKQGFGSANPGEVYLELRDFADMAQLDFSKQGDRSGGFVMPNLRPSALSRALGPTAGAVSEVVGGKVVPEQFFPNGNADVLPLPLLFGCIPLSAVIEAVGNIAKELGQAPKFASEAGTKVESFFNDLLRLYQFVSALASQPAGLAQAALDVVRATLLDLVQQAAAYGAAQAGQVNTLVANITGPLQQLRLKLAAVSLKSFDGGNPLASIDLGAALDPPQGSGALRQALAALKTGVAGAPALAAGFRQSVNAVVAQANALLDGLALLNNLYTHGLALFKALKSLLDSDVSGESLGELLGQPEKLGARLHDVADALKDLRDDVAGFGLLDGPARKTLLEALDAAALALEALGDFTDALANLLGEELVVRFDWQPAVKSWGFDPQHPLFVVHDKHAFIVAVEARMKKSGGAPKIQVRCGLRHFDLVLIAPASFIELNFDKIEFSVDSAAKMNVDVLLSDIKFVGPLSFIETLRDLIPLDGFSDPPYLDITPQGIDAGFSVALPSISCGVLNLSNVSLGAGFTVPFIGQPLSVRFNFCTREQPFHLTVYVFGGGGFFGLALDPHGVQLLEAAFEFGAAISIDLGVASGGVSVMAGIYFRMEQDAASLTGYFRLEGHVDVLGLITASLELYLELRYEFETGKAVGRATLTIEIEVLVFSGSVTITCERKFAGSNGDPGFRQLMGLSADAALPLADELAAIGNDTAYAWREYCEAFA